MYLWLLITISGGAYLICLFVENINNITNNNQAACMQTKIKTYSCISKYSLIIILVILVLFFLLLKIEFNITTEWIAIIVAFFIGLVGIFQEILTRLFFKPLFEVYIRESLTISGTMQPFPQLCHDKYYNFVIKNRGFSSAKNLKVKIKDAESGECLYLKKPFGDFLMKKYNIDIFNIKNLLPRDEEVFNIGHIDEANQKFDLCIPLSPNNQKVSLSQGEEHNYLLSITSDNSRFVNFKLNIKNNGFNNFNNSNIILELS